MSFNYHGEFIAVCDYCKKECIETVKKDTVSANDELRKSGWHCGKFPDGRETMHLCHNCNDEVDS